MASSSARPRLQRMRPVAVPIGALVVEIAAQKGMDALRAMPHVGVGRARRIIPLVMLARPVQPCQRGMDVGLGSCPPRRVGGVERQFRRTGERRAHQRQRTEHIRPHQRAPGGDRGAEIVADDRGHVAAAQGRDQPQRVADRVQNAKRAEIAVIIGGPAGRAAIAALVGGDDVKPGLGERRHYLAPGIRQLREAVEQQDGTAAAAWRTRPPAHARAGR